MSFIRSPRALVAGIALFAVAAPAATPVVSNAAETSPATTRSTTERTTWLCNPTLLATDPCRQNLSYEVEPAFGATTVTPVATPAHPPVDCFFAYPTVSAQPTGNSNLEIDGSEIAVASIQAAPFSRVCRVFSPMYRQVTSSGLMTTDRGKGREQVTIAYNSLLSGFKAFLAQEPKGRHFVLIGHSQGSAMLIRLIASQIDNNPALRNRLVSAILIGGNLTVPVGKKVGGAFKHIPLCTSRRQLGCAIAYSAFYSQPPATSLFGRPGQGVSLMWGQTSKSKNLQVACVNPSSFSKSPAPLDARFFQPTKETGFIAYPGLYRSQCQSSKGATFLHVIVNTPSAATGAGQLNDRPLAPSTRPDWGLHNSDVNLGAGGLVSIVAGQETALASHR
ncbi:MAG: DUF3089 domain-containing protein [Actinomycetes bacterium]